jgi:hypothetical protein
LKEPVFTVSTQLGIYTKTPVNTSATGKHDMIGKTITHLELTGSLQVTGISGNESLSSADERIHNRRRGGREGGQLGCSKNEAERGVGRGSGREGGM